MSERLNKLEQTLEEIRNEPEPTEEEKEIARMRAHHTWKSAYRNHLSYLRGSYPERGPNGEVVNEDWYHNEATDMADAVYRMRSKMSDLQKHDKRSSEVQSAGYTNAEYQKNQRKDEIKDLKIKAGQGDVMAQDKLKEYGKRGAKKESST